jgi:hypothetical protein
MLKQLLFLEQHTTYAIYGSRYLVAVELTYVLMTLGAEIIPPVLVQAQVELCPVLYDRFVQRRQQDMVFIVQLRQRHHKQAVVLTGVAIHNGSSVIFP